MTTCRYHCVGCGAHFTSLAAFDEHRWHRHGRHRTGWHGILDSGCTAPSETSLTARRGECHIAGDVTKDAKIWSVPRGECRTGDVTRDAKVWNAT